VLCDAYFETWQCSRGKTESNAAKIEALEALGATSVYCSMTDVPALTDAFAGCDVAISIIHGTAAVIGEREGFLLDAAIAAKVGRFLPCEFGCNTAAMPEGSGLLFDEKKKFQRRMLELGVPFTLIFPGLIMDYSLPNLREYEVITTYGELDCKFPVTHCDDIGRVTVRAALDPRCVNKGVQIAANWICQRDFLPLLEKYYPGHTFETRHVDAATVLQLAEHGDLVEPHEQPERERHQINRACYVWALVVAKDPHADTLDAQELFPDISFIGVDEIISDPEFVFGKGKVPPAFQK